ncbi:MAG: hypothetical protein PHH54_04360 [Candidatus Nanoarchaeia archaeon]|nr:hypothetical protein [Candidatus Nanoarchaeia archaeon]MDD5741193.1 hypothetical protein [Candidatus Nanoarchaeia archaeon]
MVNTRSSCCYASEREATLYGALAELDVNKKREPALIKVVKSFDLSILDYVKPINRSLLEIQNNYLQSGKKAKHRIEDYWDSKEIDSFNGLVNCLNLESDDCDAVRKGKVFIKKGKVNVIPTCGWGGGKSSDEAINGMIFGAVLGGVFSSLGQAFYQIIKGNSIDTFNVYSIGRTALIGGLIVGYIFSRGMYIESALVNPFERIASGLEQRADYVSKNILEY